MKNRKNYNYFIYFIYFHSKRLTFEEGISHSYEEKNGNNRYG